MRPYDLVTFDCYGTLIDWERGIVEAFTHFGEPRGWRIETEALVDAYHRIEPEVQRPPFRSYHAVLREVARRVAGEFGWSLDGEASAFLPESVPSWPVFADTVPVLREMQRAGYALGILSNVDDRLLRGTLTQMPIDFEFLVTAQAVKAYKPSHDHFDAALGHAAGRRWLHVAQSFFHDIAPSLQRGLPCVWVNRKGEPGPKKEEPMATVRSLDGFWEWLRNH